MADAAQAIVTPPDKSQGAKRVEKLRLKQKIEAGQATETERARFAEVSSQIGKRGRPPKVGAAGPPPPLKVVAGAGLGGTPMGPTTAPQAGAGVQPAQQQGAKARDPEQDRQLAFETMFDVLTRCNRYNATHGGFAFPVPIVRLVSLCAGECAVKYGWVGSLVERAPEVGAIGGSLAIAGQSGVLYLKEVKKGKDAKAAPGKNGKPAALKVVDADNKDAPEPTAATPAKRPVVSSPEGKGAEPAANVIMRPVIKDML